MSIVSRALQLALVAFGLCVFFSNVVSAQPISARVPHVSIKATNDVCRADEPCELDVTVQNTNAKPMTILAWNNPVDSLADELGVFEVRDSKGNVVDLNYIAVRRVTPPPASDLVEIAPKGSINLKVALKTLSTAEELPAGSKYTVAASGWWQAIWDETKQTVVATHLQKMDGSFSGDFTSNSVPVTKA
ncbi:hypothetical protein FQN49_002210 [Arthroderma sp. PD_2]|nr:hypothetical protein FQN49_002210 [Arthroderma sp. PD_2]